MIYSTIGAILEHVSYFIISHKKKLVANPILEGFPMYGIGGLFLVWLNGLIFGGQTHKNTGLFPTENSVPNDNILIQFLISAIALTIIEAGPSSNRTFIDPKTGKTFRYEYHGTIQVHF